MRFSRLFMQSWNFSRNPLRYSFRVNRVEEKVDENSPVYEAAKIQVQRSLRTIASLG